MYKSASSCLSDGVAGDSGAKNAGRQQRTVDRAFTVKVFAALLPLFACHKDRSVRERVECVICCMCVYVD